jgi:hypothetical protein
MFCESITFHGKYVIEKLFSILSVAVFQQKLEGKLKKNSTTVIHLLAPQLLLVLNTSLTLLNSVYIYELVINNNSFKNKNKSTLVIVRKYDFLNFSIEYYVSTYLVILSYSLYKNIIHKLVVLNIFKTLKTERLSSYTKIFGDLFIHLLSLLIIY